LCRLVSLSISATAIGRRAESERRQETTAMIGKILSFGHFLGAGNERAAAACAGSSDTVSAENVRALATGAALAVALDTSPAVLVSIYDYAHRFRQHEHRRITC
jgi:hypothetical protein